MLLLLALGLLLVLLQLLLQQALAEHFVPAPFVFLLVLLFLDDVGDRGSDNLSLRAFSQE